MSVSMKKECEEIVGIHCKMKYEECIWLQHCQTTSKELSDERLKTESSFEIPFNFISKRFLHSCSSEGISCSLFFSFSISFLVSPGDDERRFYQSISTQDLTNTNSFLIIFSLLYYKFPNISQVYYFNSCHF